MREADCLQLDQVQATVRAWCELGGGTMTLVRRNGATSADLARSITDAVAALLDGFHSWVELTRDQAVLTIERDEVES